MLSDSHHQQCFLCISVYFQVRRPLYWAAYTGSLLGTTALSTKYEYMGLRVDASQFFSAIFDLVMRSSVRWTTRASSQIAVTELSAATACAQFQNTGALSCKHVKTEPGTSSA